MCLTIDKQLKAKVARRNFVVSKYLRVYNGNNYGYSPFKNFVYIFGKEYTVKPAFTKRIKPYRDGNVIFRGLHSCLKGKRKRGVNGKECYAIIPKGAYYIIGKYNDIVSDKLIVKKVWKRTKK